MSRQRIVLTFNAGSSTVKIGVFQIENGRAAAVGKATIDLRLAPLAFELTVRGNSLSVPMVSRISDDLRAVIDEAFGILTHHFEMNDLAAVGHRVVHGGLRFTGPILLDDAAVQAIDGLTPLAPLHQPQALRFIRAVQHLKPGLRQTASFDTAFHAGQDDLVRRLAIPRKLHDEGIRRYGFHGLSYKFVAGELARLTPETCRKAIVAHLGSGASLCALQDGASRDCSMGFSTLDGIPMATRPGWLDVGVVMHLLGPRQMDYSAVEDLLYHKSGLLGVSGISADARELLAAEDPAAAEAIDLFALRIAGEIGRMCATLGGIDAIVFTAGIGEHQPDIRRRVCDRLSWLGVEIDQHANASNAFSIARPSSRVGIYVIATNEEQVIADEALAAISKD